MKLRIIKRRLFWEIPDSAPVFKVQKYGRLFGVLWHGWWTIATYYKKSSAMRHCELLYSAHKAPSKEKIKH